MNIFETTLKNIQNEEEYLTERLAILPIKQSLFIRLNNIAKRGNRSWTNYAKSVASDYFKAEKKGLKAVEEFVAKRGE